ncbi:hypothetical protein CNQ84_02630 [Pseudomonas abyssi]|jgi:uncharacterized protein|uniref:MYND finger n=1 Tax=Pseudomonas abyssi TaxID=170540 RepID=A0A2A3MKQ0_9PSED|nr:PP0621 family protein [Pseudomonas abyssi]MAC99981.1 hypothetical protein [Pseudomonadales bacterium]PBK05420.1 hypothetical protein CNQ84_02630 [Pseudomonas abyssi]|tara:strand:+ start:86486 stop:86728 length:243 start_codon:yes stop_codon:yes gene_type:complete
MGLIKLIFLALLVWFALRLWRGLQRQQATQRQQQSARAQQEPPLMVRCAQCQVHLPQSSALRANDNWYCCAEHRDEHQQR